MFLESPLLGDPPPWPSTLVRLPAWGALCALCGIPALCGCARGISGGNCVGRGAPRVASLCRALPAAQPL